MRDLASHPGVVVIILRPVSSPMQRHGLETGLSLFSGRVISNRCEAGVRDV